MVTEDIVRAIDGGFDAKNKSSLNWEDNMMVFVLFSCRLERGR